MRVCCILDAKRQVPEPFDLQDNQAGQDGGGISLAEGAILRVMVPTCESECNAAMRGNGKCDLPYVFMHVFDHLKQYSFCVANCMLP